jgi:hypothetical protein
MKPGPLEIVLIIVVVIGVALIARIVRPVGRQPAASEKRKSRPRSGGFLNKAGIFLIIGGALVLTAAASLFRWVLQGYLWALILIAGGVIMILLARRRR